MRKDMKGKLLQEKIINRRLDLDISQKVLSEETGVSINTIKHIETGRMIGDIENLEKICKYLKINLEDIYFPEFRVTKVLTLLNAKGGVGKTSLTSNLGYMLSTIDNNKYKVLLIDGDQQTNMSTYFGFNNEKKHFGEAILNEKLIDDYILETEYEGLDIVCANDDMIGIDLDLYRMIEKEKCVKNSIKSIIEKGVYDFIIFDTSPYFGMLNYSILNATDFIIIPIDYSAFSLDGLNKLLTKLIYPVKKTNPELKILGTATNKYDLREKKTNDDCEIVLDKFFGTIHKFETKLGIDTSVKKAQFENIPVYLYDKNCKYSKQLKQLAEEVVSCVDRS